MLECIVTNSNDTTIKFIISKSVLLFQFIQIKLMENTEPYLREIVFFLREIFF